MAIRKYFTATVVLLCAAVMIAGCGSSVSPEEQTEAPLLPPANVGITRTGSGDILLAWDANTQSHLKGYNVYRSVYGADTFTKLNSALVGTNSYTDTGADFNVRYEYRVTAVSTRNVETSYASVVIFNGIPGCGEKRPVPKI